MRRRATTANRTSTQRRQDVAVARPLASTPPVELLSLVSWAGFLVVLALLLAALTSPARAESLAPPDAATLAPAVSAPPASADSLAELLVVPHRHHRRDEPTSAQVTDAFLAAEVARGHEPSAVKPSGFRKRNMDLFRTERPVEIGEQEMLLRLRLRAKRSEAVSVELRF